MSLITFQNGSNKIIITGNATGGIATEGKSRGKWYWENKFNSGTYAAFGVANKGEESKGWQGLGKFLVRSSHAYVRSGSTQVLMNTTFDIGDIVGVAIDIEASTIDFYKNGVKLEAHPYDLTPLKNGEIYAYATRPASAGEAELEINLGASSFKYPIPEGYKPYQPEKTLVLSAGNAYTHDGISWQSVGQVPTDMQARKYFYAVHGMEEITVAQARELGSALPNGKGKPTIMYV